MRRQARISGGGALLVRTASALQVWLWLLIFVFQNEFRISRSIQPGYLDFDNLPETNFTCAGKVIGGYYADTETSCQMFHVCTVGAENETMDIKFLCLNGTVFDQETRVCERVDEVDCTKSEKFYSLNLELYGSTLPPVDLEVKPQEEPTEEQSKHSQEDSDPTIIDSSTSQEKQQAHQSDVIDSTEDPVQENVKEEPQIIHIPSLSQLPEHKDPFEEKHEEEIESEHPEYEEIFTHPPYTTTTQTTSTSMITTTTITKQPYLPSDLGSSHVPSSGSHLITTPSQILSSLSPPQPVTEPSATSDPSLLSPKEFTYRHRGTGSEAISFQRQSIRPADGVFITHAPPQFDPFQYESSRTAPRPTSFVQRPQPSPFRTTTSDPRDQLLRPGSTSQTPERNPIPNNRTPYSSSLPTQTNFPFDPFYYEHHKRSDESAAESVLENESFLTARSVAPPTVTERHVPKIKSPPRVIVTASASVSDSNGRRLNYTVGNVVSAVKPSVHINYDDYKESDVDPFFLDVPKLKRRRKSRSNRNKTIISVPATATIHMHILKDKTTTENQLTSQATTTENTSTTTSTTTAAWNPNDYVDDNYEPHAYVHPVHLHALLVDNDQNNHHGERKLNSHGEDRGRLSVGHLEVIRPTSSVAQTTSSHSTGSSSTSAPSASPPHRRSTHSSIRQHHEHH